MVGGYLNTESSAWERMLVMPETVCGKWREMQKREPLVMLHFSALLKTKPFDLQMKQLAQ